MGPYEQRKVREYLKQYLTNLGVMEEGNLESDGFTV